MAKNHVSKKFILIVFGKNETVLGSMNSFCGKWNNKNILMVKIQITGVILSTKNHPRRRSK